MIEKKLYIVTGFLGSGKTTFLKQLFELFKDRKIAVIVNEFGKESIDGVLLSEKGISISEISNGSIFCVCRSDMFIETLVESTKRDIELIIVETSGLADPTNMPEIIENANRLSGDLISFKGTITLVDAKNFEKVKNTALSVERQIKSADLIIINKSDTVNEDKIKQIKNEISDINKNADIKKTSYAKIDSVSWIDNLNNDKHEDLKSLMKLKMIGQQKMFIKMNNNYRFDDVRKWIDTFKDMTYRIKGFILIDYNMTLVNGVNGDVEYIKVDNEVKDMGIVILASGTQPVKKQLISSWNNIFNKDIIIE